MRRVATDPIGRLAAAAMVACGIVHVGTAVDHFAMSPALSGLTLVVAPACLHCVAGVWRRPGRTEWVWVTLGSAAMLVLHLAMIVTMAAPTVGGHSHQHTVTAAAAGADALTIAGLLLPTLCLGLAWFALSRISCPPPGTIRSLRTRWSSP